MLIKHLMMTGILCISICALAAQASDIYKWVDDKGVTHYSLYPPRNQTAEKLSRRLSVSSRPEIIEPLASSDQTDMAPKTEQGDESASKEATKVYAKNPKRCAIARKNLQTLKTSARIRATNKQGNLHFITLSERNEKIKQAQAAIAESC